MANLIVFVSLSAAAALLFAPRLTRSPVWRATVTPLASIIGSGFLVSLPLLVHDLGSYAVLGMGFLVVFSYLLGGAIRFNILHGEPLFAEPRQRPVDWLEETSHLALALAYFISVTYYLTLLAAFLLKGVGITDPLAGKILTTAILVAIGVDGLIQGLRGLENIEEYAVGLKLAVIAAALAALAWLNLRLAAAGTWHLPHLTASIGWHSIRTVLGLLIVVQGFETSRFLAGAYPPELRTRTMRYAQWLSGAIYLAFFLLAMVALNEQDVLDTEVTGIIAVLKPAASALPLLVIVGAIFAQLSAAVADAIGAGGLVEQTSQRKIDHRHAYPLIALVGVGLTWSLDIFGVIALASRAFALFYFLQCLVSASVAVTAPGVRRRALHVAGFLVLALLALAVVLFGTPSQGI
jgi:small neutral amino acid transporter SnatA (MarC family)